MKKILITWSNWMLATDFAKLFSETYELIYTDYKELDITDIFAIEKKVEEIKPEIIINLAAYTAVDDAEDIWMKMNYDVNTLWVYNLAKVSKNCWADFITISSDYVFSWEKEEWYNEDDKITNPVNQYWMAKYLSEKLSKQENEDTIIIRTSWLYGGWSEYKNFVNTMISLWNKLDSLKVINDQFWNPTNAKDISEAIWKLITNIEKYRGQVLHFSNTTEWKWISWYDFASEIFKLEWISVELIACDTSEFLTKAKRPSFSKLVNNSDIQLRGWKEWLMDYLSSLKN